jgi:hypothetical protein
VRDDLVIVGVLIMTLQTLGFSERLTSTWHPASQPHLAPKERPRRVPVLIIDKMVKMI